MIWIISLCLAACTPGPTDYYMDSIAGDDTNSGTSSRRPWKSLERLNQQTFRPGDRIFFKAGTEYVGSFRPMGNGDKNNPIVVSRYGEGGDPILNGDGQQSYTILLSNNTYWRISNLEIMNKGKGAATGRKGIWVNVTDNSQVVHIELSNLVVHDVMSTTENNQLGGGICFSSVCDSTVMGTLDISVDSCHIYRCYPWRIYVEAPGSDIRMKDNFIR